MVYRKFRMLLLISLVLGGLMLTYLPAVQAARLAQIPTGAIPTVTGTRVGPVVAIKPEIDQDQVNLRAGPSSTDYAIVGVLIAGQQAPALGRTAAGLWIQIVYPGVEGGVAWVYAPLVNVIGGELPIVEAPPTPTPRTTPTIDPTLAAQFIVDLPPTRLPTFTPPPPLVIPTFPADEAPGKTAGVPMGFVIVGLGAVGLFGTLISLLRGR